MKVLYIDLLFQIDNTSYFRICLLTTFLSQCYEKCDILEVFMMFKRDGYCNLVLFTIP